MELRRKQKQPMMIEIRISVTLGLLYMLTRARESLLECWKCWFHGYVYVYLLCVYSMPICFIYVICWVAAAAAKSLQLCPTLCDHIDGSPPGSSVHGIFQARVLDWGETGRDFICRLTMLNASNHVMLLMLIIK